MWGKQVFLIMNKQRIKEKADMCIRKRMSPSSAVPTTGWRCPEAEAAMQCSLHHSTRVTILVFIDIESILYPQIKNI